MSVAYNVMTYIREIFKNIEGTNYSMSNKGRMRNDRTNAILTPLYLKSNYQVQIIKVDGKQKTFYAHRMVAALFMTNFNSLMDIGHKDNDRTNNSLDNLYVKNRSRYIKNKKAKSSTPYNYRRKFTDIQIRVIRRWVCNGIITIAMAAKKLNVDKKTIWNIKHGFTYKHVK
jgi:hypothetical protein